MENGTLIEDHREISEIINDHYINVIENITGKKQEGLYSESSRNRNQTEREEIRNSMLEKYSGHPSILNMKQNFSLTERNIFQFKEAEPSDILKIIRSIKLCTSVGENNIPPKRVAMSAEVIPEPFTNLINSTMPHHFIFPVLKRKPQ